MATCADICSPSKTRRDFLTFSQHRFSFMICLVTDRLCKFQWKTCFEIFISVFSCRQKISISLHKCQWKTKRQYISDLLFGILNQNKGNKGLEKLFIRLILFLFFFFFLNAWIVVTTIRRSSKPHFAHRSSWQLFRTHACSLLIQLRS